MRNILVPSDFTATAENATQLAVEIANNVNATIYLLHVVEYNFAGPLEPDGTFAATAYEKSTIERLLKQGEEKLLTCISKHDVQSVQIESVLGLGRVEEVITQKIAELDIDLIIMGTHGVSGLQEFFIGSNAEKVVRKAKCPVITLKEKTAINEINHIVFGSDFMKVSDQLVTELKQLQDLFNASLSIVRVNTPSNFERDEVIKPFKEEILKKFNSKNTSIHIYNDNTLEEGLRNFSNENDGNIIALATHGRKGLGHLIAGSMAEDIMNHTKKAVWISHL
jgi:nucleotide-binding universal stress UspA family protein